MGRRRLKPKGKVVYHHVMTRTAQQIFWLEEPEIKEIFIDLIDFYSQVYYVEILGHVCMSNHTHLCLAIHREDPDVDDLRRRYELAQTRLANPRPFRDELAEVYYDRYTDLSKLMWEINRRMAVAYNKRKGTKGHFWGAPFKNVVVEDGQSLLNVLAYIELNPVRAGLVEDPADFPHSSVGRIREKLDKGEQPKAPDIRALQAVPEEMRAQTYLDWIRYVALTATDPDAKRQGLPILLTNRGLQVDMSAVCEALETRAPANWSASIYGTEAFAKKTLMETGWLIPLSPQRGPTRSGSTEAVA